MRRLYQIVGSLWVVLLPVLALAAPGAGNSDPFPHPNISSNTDILDFTGQTMQTGMKYALIGGGIIMILIGIGVVASRLREDSNSRETGSFITTLIIAGLTITVGIVLIAIGWTAATTNISPN